MSDPLEGLRIRAATLADLAVLRHFEQQIIEAERPFDPTLRASGAHYYDIELLLHGDSARVLVAELAGEPIGCGLARIEASKACVRHTHHGYLGLMYVDPRWRGRGVNARILDELMAWCRARGLSELRLEVYDANEAAVRAYAKSGFVAHMLEMRFSLENNAHHDAQAPVSTHNSR